MILYMYVYVLAYCMTVIIQMQLDSK